MGLGLVRVFWILKPPLKGNREGTSQIKTPNLMIFSLSAQAKVEMMK